MEFENLIIARDKASRHLRNPSTIYQGTITSVRDDGRVYVKIHSLNLSLGPIMPINTTPLNKLSKGDIVVCAFTDDKNTSLVILGCSNKKLDVYAQTEAGISIYADSQARDAGVPSPSEGRVVYLLDTDELQIYNGTEWITVIDTGNSENITVSTLTVLGSSFLSASTTIGTITPTELSYLDGTTSAIQAQINAKAPLASPTFTGNVSIGGELAYHPIPETSSVGFTMQLAQDGKIVKLTNSTSASVTIPLSSSVSFPIGSQISLIRYGTGSVSVVGSGSVAVRATPGQSLRAQYSSMIALKIDSDEWILMGDLV